MGSIAKYAAVNTKIKALERKFLSSEQYNKLVETKDYNEAVKYLKEETPYYDVLKEYDIEDIHRKQLEHILKENYIKNFHKLSHYFSGDYKKLFSILFIRFEVEDLKNIFRAKYLGKSKDEIELLITYRSPLSHVDYDKLIEAKDVYEVGEYLKNTKYYKHLGHVIEGIKEEGLFRIETALDFIYFNSIKKFIKNLNNEDKELMSKFLGIYNDLLNIQWIFRGKKYYTMSPEELLNYTIYNGYKLNINSLKELCYSKDMEEFFKLVSNTSYREVFGDGKKDEYLVQRDIHNYLKKIYLQYQKKHENNISVAIAYLELALLEVIDIVSIIESTRYNISNEETLKYVTTIN